MLSSSQLTKLNVMQLTTRLNEQETTLQTSARRVLRQAGRATGDTTTSNADVLPTGKATGWDGTS